MQTAIPAAIGFEYQTKQTQDFYGLQPRKLDIPGRKRIEIDYGKPIGEIITWES